MADNAASVIAIEFLAAAQGCDFHAPLSSSAPLEPVRTRLRGGCRTWKTTAIFAPDIAAAVEMVRERRGRAAAAGVQLPASRRAGVSETRRRMADGRSRRRRR